MSGEDLIEEKCVNCIYFDDYDGCTKSGLVYYNAEEECIECEDYKEIPDAESEYWDKYNVEENKRYEQ